MTGLGIYLPESFLTNEQIETGMPWLDTDARWIVEHTGIQKRHVAAKDQHTTDLGFLAAKEALDLGGVEPQDIDLILMATNTSRYIYPAAAVRIQQAFGTDPRGRLIMHRAGALDLQQGCSSFIGGIGLAFGLIRGGTFKRVLVVGADVASRMVDWTDRDSILLGDAAAACVLTSEEPSRPLAFPPIEILGHFMRSDSKNADAISQKGPLNAANHPFDHIGRELIESNGHPALREQLYGRDYFGDMAEQGHRFFRMDGRQVYRFVKGIVPRQGYLEVLKTSGLLEDAPPELGIDALSSLEDIKDRALRREVVQFLASKVDLFIPHSANLSLNQELAEEMGVPFERMYVTLHKYGNTSAASVGLSLYEALRHPSCYTTLTKRDGKGDVKSGGCQVSVGTLEAGQTALLLSFGAGNSWNYVMTRRG
ncbi:MAG: 3-oxoacyl-ACP synthase III family protein [Planctomycetota bacterium]